MPQGDWAPSDEDLLAFDSGLLSEAEIDSVAHWLDSCPDGEDRLRKLTENRSDDAVEALRRPSSLTSEFEHLSALTSQIIGQILSKPAPPANSAPPTAVREYQLIRELGKGGMGSVYLARHTRLQREVAFKLLPAHLAADPQFRGRFEREMAVVGQLDHPNLVRAYDAGVEEDKLFLVMELLTGENLATLVEQKGPLRPADACELIRQAALGLEFAHQHNMVHRDVKPGNLFLTKAGCVKLIDLGLARVQDAGEKNDGLSSIHAVMGTPHYMSPEQWENAPNIDARADVYGLGCTLYYLLTGRTPFFSAGGKGWLALSDAHRHQQAPSVRDARAEIPGGLDRLVAQMLAKKPEGRPQTAESVTQLLLPWTAGHDLIALLAGGASQPRPATKRIPTPPLNHHPLRRAATVAALAMILLSGWLLWYIAHNRGTTSEDITSNSLKTRDEASAATPLALKPVRALKGHTAGVLALAISPDQKILASGGRDQQILLWDTQTWQPRGPLLGHRGEVVGLAFSPDGKTLASVSGEPDSCAIRLWNPVTGQPVGELGGPSQGVFGLSFSPDGKTLACGGYDRKLQFFEVASGKERLVAPTDVTLHIRGLSFSPDGSRIVTGGSGPTQMWDTATGKEIPMANRLPEGFCPTFLPGGKTLAGWMYSRGRIAVCDAVSGKLLAAWRTNANAIQGMAVSPDGNFLVSLGDNGAAKVWTTTDQRMVADLVGHGGGVYAAVFSADGTRLFTCDMDDQTILEWNLPPNLHAK